MLNCVGNEKQSFSALENLYQYFRGESVRYLTKSAFSMGYDCPQQLFYYARKDIFPKNDPDAMAQATIGGGHQIGALAQKMYIQSDGELAHEIDSRDQQQQIMDTREWLSQDTVTLFEPTIVHGDCLVRVDVLRKRGNQVELIEVKSKSFDSLENPALLTKPGDYVSYVRDLAFQYWVLSQAYPDWDITPYLMLVDKTEPAKQDRLHHLFPIGEESERALPEEDILETPESSFLKRVPLADWVQKELEGTHQIPGFMGSFEDTVAHMIGIYCREEALAGPPIGSHCKKCRFYAENLSAQQQSGFHQCWKSHFDGEASFTIDDTIFGLYDPPSRGPRSRKALIERGWHKLIDVEPSEIDLPAVANGPLTTKDRQRMQVDWAKSSKSSEPVTPYFDREGFKKTFEETIENTGWPLYFLDFEGSTSPLPLHVGQQPNSIQLFQYSVHVMHQGGRIEHLAQHINLEPDPEVNLKMVRDLRDTLGKQGTIFRWHNYENTNLNKVREQLLAMSDQSDDIADLVQFIESITIEKQNKKIIRCGPRNMVDQFEWAQEYYFHPDTQGGSGIKKLLPAVMSSSKLLKEKYSQPIYGTKAIPSKNPHHPIWWVPQTDDPSRPVDPYKLLEDPTHVASSAEGVSELDYEEIEAVQEGGAATLRYLESQSGLLSKAQMEHMKGSLLRYCELDTFAMVMIMEAWLAEIGYWS